MVRKRVESTAPRGNYGNAKQIDPSTILDQRVGSSRTAGENSECVCSAARLCFDELTQSHMIAWKPIAVRSPVVRNDYERCSHESDDFDDARPLTWRTGSKCKIKRIDAYFV
jgi:hypothetical protein